MILQAALEYVNELKARYGRSHCANTNCLTCQIMAMGREVERLSGANATMRKRWDDSRCSHCGTFLVDGMCGRCSS